MCDALKLETSSFHFLVITNGEFQEGVKGLTMAVWQNWNETVLVSALASLCCDGSTFFPLVWHTGP